MANAIGNYNEAFFANEALISLQKQLGMAGAVHRGYDEERRSSNKGDVINIRGPAKFTAQDAGSSATDEDLDTRTVQVTLDNFREVRFAVTDPEFAYTGDRIIADHIEPAAYELAQDLDSKLVALYKDIPWFLDIANPMTIANIVDVRKQLRDNEVPLAQRDRMWFMVDSIREADLLKNQAFTQHQGAGDLGVSDQVTGEIGPKFGFRFFVNQNVPTHTPGVSADADGALNADAAKGATQIVVKDVTAAGTFKQGDTLVIAGNTQRYAITADATASGGIVTLNITPKLVQAHSEDDVVSIDLDSHVANLAFHRNAFALATAPLPRVQEGLGARSSVVQDPVTRLSIRATMWYDAPNKMHKVSLDMLYGFVTLDPNLACRARG